MRVPVSFILVPGIAGRGRVFRQDTGQEISRDVRVSKNPWLPWTIGAEITLEMFERPLRLAGDEIASYFLDVVVVEHRETRLERLLPPASSGEQKLDRGICPICFVRLAECMKDRAVSLRREPPTGPPPGEIGREFNAELARSSTKCSRKGCDSPGVWAPRIEIRPYPDYQGKPITAWATLTVCDQHRAWFIESSGAVIRETESVVRQAGFRVDSSLTRMILEPVQRRTVAGGRA